MSYRPSGELPNILLIQTDQHNAGVMSCAGHPDVLTPNLDRLSLEGVRFERAYCQNGVCVPSRTSMFTGQYCYDLNAMRNGRTFELDTEKVRPLTAVLKANGYITAAFGKRHLVREIS